MNVYASLFVPMLVKFLYLLKTLLGIWFLCVLSKLDAKNYIHVFNEFVVRADYQIFDDYLIHRYSLGSFLLNGFHK